PVRLGPQGPDRPDQVRRTRSRRASACPAPRARVRARAPARAPETSPRSVVEVLRREPKVVMNADPVVDLLSLLDWKRRIAELYAQIVAAPDGHEAWALWQQTRARLFCEHPQSPVPEAERRDYRGPHVFDYDPAWRLIGSVEATQGGQLELPSSDGGVMVFRRFGFVHLLYAGRQLRLEIYW